MGNGGGRGRANNLRVTGLTGRGTRTRGVVARAAARALGRRRPRPGAANR